MMNQGLIPMKEVIYWREVNAKHEGREHLEEKKHPLWDLWKSLNGIGGLIGLQFHSLHPSEQLLFLDVATLQYGDGYDGVHTEFDILNYSILYNDVTSLCNVHDKTRPEMERQLLDFARSGIIDYVKDDSGDEVRMSFRMHDIYWNYAKWYATNHESKGFKNAWCVFDTLGSTQNQKYVAADLVRLRLFNFDRTSARVFASKMMQELYDLEVLQLQDCPNLTELKLGGLRSLKHLELYFLPNLVFVTLTGSGDTSERGGIFESLLFVTLRSLQALVHGPDLRSCTSLYTCQVFYCGNMTNMEELVCPTLKVLDLRTDYVEQLTRLLSVQTLHSLEVFFLDRPDELYRTSVKAKKVFNIRDLGKPCLKVVDEYMMSLRTDGVVVPLKIHWKKRNPLSEYLLIITSDREEYKWK